ncbi:MAG: hypothetical protein QOC71_19, partial [Thermoplasmata archaeon]|nr:hypothetical protein [Thermoplasmata archaeon]
MRATAILLMAAALALPPAGATPVTLYGHVVHMGQDFPLNTQEPPSDFVVDEGIGLMTNTLTCLPATGVVNTSQGYHTMYGYSSPSFVEYGQAEDGGPRVHPERGLSADARLDAASPMVLHWYFSEPQPGELGTPAPVPNVVVQATMRTGESLSVDDRAYDEGPILAQGRSAPALLAGQSSQGVEVDTVDGRIVYHFTVPMAIEEPVIPRATGFNLRVDVFVENEVCGEDKAVMPNAVLLHSSPGHRPRLELGVLDHLQLQYIHPQVVEPDLVIHTSVLDVWGVYDVVVFKATIEGPGMPATDLQPAANVA